MRDVLMQIIKNATDLSTTHGNSIDSKMPSFSGILFIALDALVVVVVVVVAYLNGI